MTESVEASLANPANLFNRIKLEASPDPSNLAPSNILHRLTPKKGRTPGKTIPLTEQILIGVTARLEGTTKAARDFGVTTTTADGYMDGSTQQGKKNPEPKPELKSALDAVLERAKSGAADRILKAVDSITDKGITKLGDEKPLLAAELAVKMATVVEKLSDKDRTVSDNRVQIVVYGPEERSEDRYETMIVPLTMEDR